MQSRKLRLKDENLFVATKLLHKSLEFRISKATKVWFSLQCSFDYAKNTILKFPLPINALKSNKRSTIQCYLFLKTHI